MKLLLMDLDGTLLDSAYFKQQLFKHVSKACGVQEEKVLKAYETYSVPITVDNWLESFIKTVSENGTKKPDIAKLKQAIFDEIRVNILQLNFLRNFDGHKVIFTFGNEKFQKEKIEYVQLMRFVDDVLITQQNKIDFIDSLVQYDSLNLKEIQYKDVTIVDDDAKFLAQVHDKYPWIKMYEKDELITNTQL